MSRNAEDGFNTYEELYNRGINLVFLKEPHINTDTYKKSLTGLVSMTNTNVDFILEGINKYLLALAKEQIRLAFEQAEKEVEDLHQRTKEGIETAKLAGKQIGKSKGDTWETKKSKEVSGEKYPVVVFVNGTGVAASRYKPVFEHLASWGFIAIGKRRSVNMGRKKGGCNAIVASGGERRRNQYFLSSGRYEYYRHYWTFPGRRWRVPRKLTKQSIRNCINAPSACPLRKKIWQKP